MWGKLLENGLLNTIHQNPFRKSLPISTPSGKWVFVLFGATGDLAHKKILPSLYSLHCFGLLPFGTCILCFASPDISLSQYHDLVAKSVKDCISFENSPNVLDDFLRSIHYIRRGPESYQTLKETINALSPSANCLFYMAVPQNAATEHIIGLERAGLGGYSDIGLIRRIVVEKPFGHNYESCRTINKLILRAFPEESIFRIDHYLGKETVQNILTLRFANQFLEPLLNRNHIDNIQISIAETVDVENRGGFYDNTGALRDVIQNHALQMMSIVMMEQPHSLDIDKVALAKTALLDNVKIVKSDDVSAMAVRGRYADSHQHTQNSTANQQTHTETFAAVKLDVENERWAGVPVFIRTGKCLAKRVTNITLVFKSSCQMQFGEFSHCTDRPNTLTIQVQPNEGVTISMETKLPGPTFTTRPVTMDFRYGTSIHQRVPDAYERLILDAFSGDQLLFAGASEIERMWRICDPVLSVWKNSPDDIETYMPGTWGPKGSDTMITGYGRRWKRL